MAAYFLDDVSVIPVAPKGLPTNGDTTVCVGDSIRLSSVTDTITDYEWSPSVGLSSDTVSGPLASPDTTTMYTVTKRTCCDTTTAQVTVYVVDTPRVEAGPDHTIDKGDTVRVGDTVQGNGDIFSWTPTFGLSDPSSLMPFAFPDSSTTYTLWITDTVSGCKVSDEVTVEVLKEEDTIPEEDPSSKRTDLFIPNIFSPNGRGRAENEVFRTYGAKFKEYRLIIFDRWGEKVFESTDPNEPWKGRTVEQGVYVYHLSGTLENGKKVERKGNVTLVK